MCFTSKDRAKYIADKDIVCYKTVSTDLISIYYDFQYQYGELYHSEFDIAQYQTRIVIEEGLHSYKTSSYAKDFLHFSCGNYDTKIVVECIIPAGSEYYMNESEYVSNQIIIVKSI